MKTISTLIIAVLFSIVLHAKTTNYEVTKANSEGFTVTIESVTDNMDSSYTIVLRVANNGKNSFSCKELANFSVEAMQGSFTNVGLNVVAGPISYASYSEGPNLGVEPFQGFKFNGFKNIGRDKAGSFKITYTINGPLQSQRVSCNTGMDSWIVRFNAKDFENVMLINKNNNETISKTNKSLDTIFEINKKNTNNSKQDKNQFDFSTIGTEASAVEKVIFN